MPVTFFRKREPEMEKIQINCRNSKIERLRIVAMFMIVTSHYAHAFEYIKVSNTFNYIFSKAFTSFGQIGVGLFLLISAYFMIGSSHKRRKIYQLHLHVLFWSICILAIFMIFQREYINVKMLLKSLFPVLFVNYWYFTTYYLLFVISPYFDMIIDRLEDQTQYKKFLGILFVFSSLTRVIPGAFSDQSISGFTIGKLIPCFVVYFLCGYIKKYQKPQNIKSGGYSSEGDYLVFSSIA